MSHSLSLIFFDISFLFFQFLIESFSLTYLRSFSKIVVIALMIIDELSKQRKHSKKNWKIFYAEHLNETLNVTMLFTMPPITSPGKSDWLPWRKKLCAYIITFAFIRKQEKKTRSTGKPQVAI
jgi:hypothetical protein